MGAFGALRASLSARPWEVALDDGVADGDLPSPALGACEPLAEGLGLWVPSGAAGVPSAKARTGRKYSWAVVPTCSRACCSFVPLGMFTMMWSRPCVWTSASCTPRPLTRRSMMPTAVFMLVSLIASGLPGSLLALSVMLVPPARSMPSRGVVCLERNIPAVSATIAIRMIARARPGLP